MVLFVAAFKRGGSLAVLYPIYASTFIWGRAHRLVRLRDADQAGERLRDGAARGRHVSHGPLTMPTTPEGRRPLASRDQPFFKHLAAALARAGVSPNAISFSSIAFGLAAGVTLAATAWTQGGTQRLAWLASAVFIQLRLIANLLDGMVAVEGRRGGPTGELWNEAPDRIADTAIFIGAGFAAGSSPLLGFSAALLSIFVAYVRALGASVGAGQIFIGPMAKPHRMAALTVLAIAGSLIPITISRPRLAYRLYREDPSSVHRAATEIGRGDLPATIVSLVLALICIGCVITAIRRLTRISAFLRSKTP